MRSSEEEVNETQNCENECHCAVEVGDIFVCSEAPQRKELSSDFEKSYHNEWENNYLCHGLDIYMSKW